MYLYIDANTRSINFWRNRVLSFWLKKIKKTYLNKNDFDLIDECSVHMKKKFKYIKVLTSCVLSHSF